MMVVVVVMVWICKRDGGWEWKGVYILEGADGDSLWEMNEGMNACVGSIGRVKRSSEEVE